MFLKHCKNFTGAQNMPIHLITYIFNRGIDASKTNLLKEALFQFVYTVKFESQSHLDLVSVAVLFTTLH